MERPRHPYIAGLIHSLPSWGMVSIPPPDPGRLEHTGCPFCSRCPRVMERCSWEAPGEVALLTGGKVRCFLHEQGAGAEGDQPDVPQWCIPHLHHSGGGLDELRPGAGENPRAGGQQ